MFSRIANYYPLAADRLWDAVKSRGGTIPITNTHWPVTDSEPLLKRLSNAHISPEAGCFAWDDKFFSSFLDKVKENNTETHAALIAAYQTLPSFASLPRIKTLANAVPELRLTALANKINNMQGLSPIPSDISLYRNLCDEYPWQHKVHISDILLTAKDLRKTPEEIVSRLNSLGFSVPETLPNWQKFEPFTQDDRILISWNLNGEAPGLKQEVNISHILLAADKLRKTPEQIVSRLNQLGFSLPENLPNWREIGPFTQDDRILISRDLYGAVPGPKHEVHISRILLTADKLGKTPEQIVSRFNQFGFSLPKTMPNWREIEPFIQDDRILIPCIWNQYLGSEEHEVHIPYILLLADELGKTPEQIVSRLKQFGFSLPQPLPNWRKVGPFTQEDLILVSWKLNGKIPLLKHDEVSITHILLAADELGKTPEQIVSRLKGLGFSMPKTLLNWREVGPFSQEDLMIFSKYLSCASNYPDASLRNILLAVAELDKTPEEIVSLLLKFGIEIHPGVWPHELEIIVQIWHDCSRKEATQRLIDAGWTPPTDIEPAPCPKS